MKIKMNLMERLMVLNTLPKESNYATLKVINDLTQAIGVTEKEFKDFEINQTADNITWNEKGKEFKDFEIGEKAKSIIAEQLIKLDKENKLTGNLFSLYEKFVGE